MAENPWTENAGPATETREESAKRDGYRPLGEILGDLKRDTIDLVRQEALLMRAEMSEKASKYSRNAVFIAAGALIAYAAFLFLLGSLNVLIGIGLVEAGLSTSMAGWIAPLILAIVVGAIGAVLVMKGVKTFKSEPLAPKRSISTLTESRHWAERKVR